MRVGRALFLCLFALTATGWPPSTTAGPQLAGYPEAETWIIEQVAAGQPADLTTRFATDAERTLNGGFLAQVLAGDASRLETRYGVHIRGAIVVEPMILDNVEIASPVWLEDCQFEGDFDVSRSRFEKDLSLDGSSLRDANFARLRVGGSLYLRQTRFEAGAVFQNADIGGQLQAEGARFESTDRGAVFDGVHVEGSALFNGAFFAGPVSWVVADVGGQFQAEAAQFACTETPATFNGLRVGNIGWFSQASFAGGADFRGLSVEGQFRADAAVFSHPEQPANFKGARVDNTVFFRKAQFHGPLILADAAVTDLLLEGPDEQTAPVPLLDLTRTEIRREMRVENLRLRDLAATSLRVGGPADLNHVTIERTAGLERARFDALTLTDVDWPAETGALWLNGMSYQILSAGPEGDSQRKLLDLANHSAYSVQVYTDLEAFFLRQGHGEWANEAYVAQRRRERTEALALTSVAWWWNAFLDVFVLYGRGPGRAFLWSMLLILIGAWVFRRRQGMIPLRPDQATDYSSFWYSLDLFLPFIDLQEASRWAPKPERRIVRHYLRVHALFGWLLIPIGLLAVTGIIS